MEGYYRGGGVLQGWSGTAGVGPYCMGVLQCRGRGILKVCRNIAGMCRYIRYMGYRRGK